MPTDSTIEPLSRRDQRSLNQLVARLGHYFQAGVRNRFGRTVRHLARFIPPEGVILDIGANHGKFAKNFARLASGSCRVYCFEPLEYNWTILERIVRPLENVRVFRFALAEDAGETDLFVPVRPTHRLLPGSAHMGVESAREHFGTWTSSEIRRQRIRSERLDDVMEREGIERVDFMKIDVEGAETLVLRGARETLHRHRPGIYCELCIGRPACVGLTVEDAVALLENEGYRMHTLDDRTGEVRPCATVQADIHDYLFLHPQNPCGTP